MSKEQILSRIREALCVPTVGHVERDLAGGAAPRQAPRAEGDFEHLWEQFAERSRSLRTEVLRLSDRAACRDALRALAESEGWTRAASHHAELADSILDDLGLSILWVDEGFEPAELEPIPVGISTCEALVAQSGSAVVSPARGGGRALSALPPHHVILATRDELVADLPAAIARLQDRYRSGWPSFLSVITGPSRTGDIERILVLGAHGPKRLTVILIDEGGSA